MKNTKNKKGDWNDGWKQNTEKKTKRINQEEMKSKSEVATKNTASV